MVMLGLVIGLMVGCQGGSARKDDPTGGPASNDAGTLDAGGNGSAGPPPSRDAGRPGQDAGGQGPCEVAYHRYTQGPQLGVASVVLEPEFIECARCSLEVLEFNTARFMPCGAGDGVYDWEVYHSGHMPENADDSLEGLYRDVAGAVCFVKAALQAGADYSHTDIHDDFPMFTYIRANKNVAMELSRLESVDMVVYSDGCGGL